MAGIIIEMVQQKRIDEEELKYLFTTSGRQQFFRNRVVILDKSPDYNNSYERAIEHLDDWCSKNCEGFFMLILEYHEDASSCFFFQLKSDLVHFKLVHDNTKYQPNKKT